MSFAVDSLISPSTLPRILSDMRRATALVAFALAGGCTSTPVPPRDFAECVARGNAIMESFPRQCRDEGSGKLFREKGEAVVPAQ